MTHNIPDWDTYYFNQCKVIQTRSKDKHTQCGCIIVSQDNRPLSQGYNSLPSGANDDVPERYQRPTKYLYQVHSERNGVYSAARHGIALDGSKIYVTGLPCMDCAQAIIQAGIREVIYDGERQARWNSPLYQDGDRVRELLEECGVHVREWWPTSTRTSLEPKEGPFEPQEDPKWEEFDA